MDTAQQLTLNAIVIGIAALTALYFEKYWIDVAVLVVIYAGVASAWNLAGGFSGTFSFGHGLFFGIGAYTAVVLFNHWGITPWLGLLLGALLGAAAGAFIAWLASRCGIGDLAFAVLTLAIAETVYLFVDSFDPLGASRGISLSPAADAVLGMQFSTETMYLVLGTALLVVCQLVSWLVYRSSMGHRFRAVRENPVASEAMGINPTRERVWALAISAALTAVAGVVYAQYLLFVNPLTFFGPNITIKVILFALIGGMGTIWGPVLGAALFFPLGEWLRAHFGGQLPGFDTLIYGSLVIVTILLFPKGVVGTISRKLGNLKARGATANKQSPAGNAVVDGAQSEKRK